MECMTNKYTMAFHFAKKARQIPRIYDLDNSTFSKQYRNKKPVVLPDILSNWIPVTKWTPEYLTQVLQCTYEDKLQVLVSKDNRLFINHPDVAELVSMTSEEFASHVFRSDQCCADPESDRTRYYLRTFSMPEVLFRDIDTNDQANSLLSVIIPEKSADKELILSDVDDLDSACDSAANGERTRTGEICERDKCKSDVIPKDMNMNEVEKNPQAASVWEEFLTPASCSDDSDETETLRDTLKGEDLEESTSSSVDQDTAGVLSSSQEAHSRIFNCQTMQLWIGTRGNVTPLHYDRNHGLLAQISGRKELVLFSHKDTPFLYPHPSYSERAHTSRVNLRRLGDSNYAEIFTKVQEAQPYSCILQPGDLLYTPPFWWHDVTSLDDCVSITLPWDVENYEEVPPCMLR